LIGRKNSQESTFKIGARALNLIANLREKDDLKECSGVTF
jgi:hypothetical protein